MNISPSRFNLIDEAWIPVRKLNGERAELGIRDTLLQAKDIAVIEDPSPLVVAALHRFLLAVLYRALEGPTDIDQAKEWFKSGLPADKITAYLEKWRDRFWLFDGVHPFGQNPNVPADKIAPWTKLTAEYNATTNKVLFDHTDAKRPGVRSFAECARWLVSTMSFSVPGGAGYSPSPSSSAAMCIPIGQDLHDTLSYCLVDQNRSVIAADVPLWESDSVALPITIKKKSPSGISSLYTWPARMILLENNGADGVENIRFMAGLGCEGDLTYIDPMLGYRIDDKRGRLPIQFRERGLWRDFDSLLPDAEKLAPSVIEHATELTKRNRARFPRSVMVLGQSNDKAKIEFWRLERFVLPEALLGEKQIRSAIRDLLDVAENNQKALWRACSSFARDLLSRGERDPDKKDVSRFVEQMPVNAAYWSTLEAAFHDVLRSYTAESDPNTIRLGWLKTVRAALREAWRQHAASVSTSNAWAIRALVRAESEIKKQVGRLNKDIQDYEAHFQKQEETA